MGCHLRRAACYDLRGRLLLRLPTARAPDTTELLSAVVINTGDLLYGSGRCYRWRRCHLLGPDWAYWAILLLSLICHRRIGCCRGYYCVGSSIGCGSILTSSLIKTSSGCIGSALTKEL